MRYLMYHMEHVLNRSLDGPNARLGQAHILDSFGLHLGHAHVLTKKKTNLVNGIGASLLEKMPS